MKGRLLPRADLHLSERLPRIGVRKNPTRGDKHQIRVMWLCETPIFSRVGETKAVSAAYANSMPITAAEMVMSSRLMAGNLEMKRKQTGNVAHLDFLL